MVNKRCKTCNQKVAGENGHCASCTQQLSNEAIQEIENKSKKRRGIILEKTLDKW